MERLRETHLQDSGQSRAMLKSLFEILYQTEHPIHLYSRLDGANRQSRHPNRGATDADILELFISQFPALCRVLTANLDSGTTSLEREDVLRQVRDKYNRDLKYGSPLVAKTRSRKDDSG